MKYLVLTTLICILSLGCFAQQSEGECKSNAPVEPFRVIGNIYYAGASDITSFLITTKKGRRCPT